MKNLTKLLILILLFISLTSTAQQNDTLKIKRNDKGVITFVRFAPRNERAMANGKTILKEVLKLDQKDDFRLQKENTDKYGITHQRYQQYYNGIKVEGAEYLVHGKNGMIGSINGNYSKVVKLSTSPQLAEQQALEKALIYVDAEIYKWEDEGTEQFAKKATGNPDATYFPKGELIIIKDAMKDKGTLKLAWKFTISSLVPDNEQWIYVDAHNGNIVGDTPLILDVNTPGTAQTLYTGTQNITCDSFNGGYRLRENRNDVEIQTLDLQNTFNISNAIDFTNINVNWINGSWAGFTQDRQALDAHWGAEMVFDYWQIVHERNSIDGGGIRILSGVHASNNWDNAQWIGGKNNHYIRYGDGNMFNPLVALDICAHEFGHGVNEFEAHLGMSTGWDESDALNEGLSDIWGAVIENWAAPEKEMWLMGEELMGTGSAFDCIRNMQNPKSTTAAEGQHPDTYHGDFWRADGEPHFNSTVLSHWFYLLSEGSSGTDEINDNNDTFSINGIGVESAAAIVYQAQTNYLTSSSNYGDAREATIQAAEDSFGENSIQSYTTCQAWFAVGVGNNNCSLDIEITGNQSICGTSNSTYSLNYNPSSSTTWSVSSNLQILNSNNTSVTVKATSSTINGNGTITANVDGVVVTRTIWIGKPKITVELEPIGANYVAVHLIGENGININKQGITSTTWQKVSGSGGCYASFSGSGFEGLGHGNCTNWSVYVKITATNSCGTTTIYGTVTPPAPEPCDDTLIFDGQSIIIDPCNDLIGLNGQVIEIEEVKVYKFSGFLVYQSKTPSLNISHLQPGIYIVKAKLNNGEVLTTKILK